MGPFSSCLSFMLLGPSVQARCEAGVRCDDPVCDLHAVDRARKLHCFRLLRRNAASWKQPAPLAHTGNRDGVPRCVVGIILPASLPASRSRNGVPIIYDGLWRFPVCGRVVPRGRRYFSRTAPCHLWSILSIVIGCAVYFELVERDRRRQARVKTRR